MISLAIRMRPARLWELIVCYFYFPPQEHAPAHARPCHHQPTPVFHALCMPRCHLTLTPRPNRRSRQFSAPWNGPSSLASPSFRLSRHRVYGVSDCARPQSKIPAASLTPFNNFGATRCATSSREREIPHRFICSSTFY